MSTPPRGAPTATLPQAASVATPALTPEASGIKKYWPHVKRWLLPVLAVVVLAMLVSHARDVDWAGAWKALRAYDLQTLLIAGAFAAASFLVYGTFDLIGRRYTGHALSGPWVWCAAFVSYAFNLNLGSLVGALAMRVRLYSRRGVGEDDIGRIIGLSLVTNWLGYGALAGLLFVSGALVFPSAWLLHGAALRAVGALLIGVVVAYLVAAKISKRREWSLRGHVLRLPSLPMALLQLGVSALNWSLMGAVLYVLLERQVPYPMVLGVLLSAAIAGVATHVPAGLGVLEAVFLALLGGSVPQGQLLGAILAYRALYYLAPLMVAVVVYLVLERLARQASPAPALAPAADQRHT